MGKRVPSGPDLKVFLAGRVAVEADGVLLGEGRFPGRQGRLLFAYLVAEQGRPVPRDELADALWGDAVPATWEKALTVLVSKLRALLAECGLDGTAALTSAFGCYRLNLPQRAWVDVTAAADALREAEAALARDDLDQANKAATRAASLAGPPFLSGEEGAWVEGKRRQLTDIRRRALDCLAEACLRSGDEPEAAKWAEETIVLDPYRETGYRRLMAAHAAAGNRAEALRVYERCRQLLATELGAYPSPETESIYRELLRTPSPEKGTPASAAPPVPVIDREPQTLSMRRFTRRRAILAGALAGVVAAAVAIPLFAVGGGGSTGINLGDIGGNAVGVIGSTSGAVEDAIETPGTPSAVAYGGGSAWAASADSNHVYAIDPKTNTVRDKIEVAGAPGGIAVGARFVWVTNSLAGTVAQIDPDFGVVQTIDVGNGPTGVAVEGGHVWVANTTDGTVSKIRAGNGKPLGEYPAGSDPVAIAVGDRAVWVVNKSRGIVLKLSLGGALLKEVHVGEGPTAVAVGAGAVWVANSLSDTVSKIDPPSGKEIDIFEVGAEPSAIAVAGGKVWTTNELKGTVSRIDPLINRATEVRVGSRPTAIAAGGGVVYVALRPIGASHRGGTLAVVNVARDPIDTIDPAAGYVGAPWPPLLSLTNDGLLTYRRVGGQAGYQLVPDLARSMPRVSEDGKSYMFQVRRNIHYSNGRLVRASDFRYAIERVFKLRPRPEPVFVDSFRAIRGAERCGRQRCDLSDGIATDDAARTVTFHLSAPDPVFLYTLASSPAAAVPVGTSPQDAKRRPLPATGPYRFASFTPNRALRLVRNPHFREWSPAAQPAGFPDELVLKIVADQKTALALVQQGKADLTTAVPERPLRVPPAFRPQLHTYPTTTTFYLAFDPSQPPFDHLRARQALNYALDRRKVAQLVGGETTRRPTCQVLPPNFPGHRRYCPYTLDPNSEGGWTGADPEKATRLVAASGTAGTPVTLWFARKGGPRLGRYLVTLLKSLGYPAHLRSFENVDSYFESLRHGARPQILWSGWAADYPAASNYIEPLFACSSEANFGHFCDRALDRKIDHALELQEDDPVGANRLWAALDGEITDMAAWVPLYNLYGTDFVSKRVGNYQYNPQWGALLSQIWVR